jgi:hypothetical protein
VGIPWAHPHTTGVSRASVSPSGKSTVSKYRRGNGNLHSHGRQISLRTHLRDAIAECVVRYNEERQGARLANTAQAAVLNLGEPLERAA